MPEWEDYFIPGTETLKNKLGISDPVMLNRAEREFVEQRARQGCPKGNFDLDHLKAIHHHLFQDVYEWAGHRIDLTKLNGPAWIEASSAANRGSYGEMNDQIRGAIVSAAKSTAETVIIPPHMKAVLPSSAMTRDERLKKYSDLLDQEEAANARAARLREQAKTDSDKKTK